MLFLQTIDPQKIAAADSVAKAKFAEKITALVQMSPEEILQIAIRGAVEIILKILLALVIYFIGRWIIKHIQHLLTRIFVKRNVEVSLKNFIISLVHTVLMILLILTVIGLLGINTTSFVALLASAGLAIGMALSGTMQNFAGGIMLLILKQYRVGDYIDYQGYSGTVKEIRLFHTVINTVDNKTIIIPNSGISTNIINNYSKEEHRRVDWTFGIAYGNDYDTAKNLIAKLLDEDSRVLKEPAYLIALHSLGDSSVNIVVRAWTESADYWDVYFDMNEKVYKTFPEHGLSIPFPQMDIHISKEA